MLKNVAIPLMLAATEAEGQKFTQKEVEAAMRQDRDKFFRGLEAPEAACTAASDTNIQQLAAATSSAQQALDAAKEAVAGLEAEGGAWKVADDARKAAVEAAQAEETLENIAGLLDALDAAAGAERAAAADYAAKDKAYRAGQLAAQTAASDDSATSQEAARLLQLKNDAVAAVTAATDQHAKEMLWREWLYCELGGVAANDDNAKSNGAYVTNWWKMIASDNNISSANAAPTYCTVPAVKKTAETHASDFQTCQQNNAGYDDSNDANYATLQISFAACVTQRPAIRYYNAVCTSSCTGKLEGSALDSYAQFMARENDVAGTANAEAYWQRWTATLVHSTATTLQDAETSYQGINRSKQGEVNWLIGNLRQKQWIEQQRKREHDFYNGLQTNRGTVSGYATQMSTGASYTVPDPSPGYGMGNANADGAKKLLDAAESARDAAGAGVKTMPQARTGGTGNTQLSTWTALDDAQMKIWYDANSSAGAVRLWWDEAWQLSAAVAAWDAAYASGTNVTANSWSAATKTLAATTQNSGAGGAGPCSTAADSSNGGKWATNSDTQGAADANACKTVCTNINGASGVGLLFDADTKDNGGNVTVNRGGAKYCQYDTPQPTVAYYCGGYSFDNSAASNAKCKILYGAHDPAAGSSDVASSECGIITPHAELIDFYNLQKAVSTKYALVKNGSTLDTNMVAAVATQVDLEKAWLQAWYVQQYWAELVTELNVITNSSMAKTIQGFVTTLEGNAALGRASKLGSEADATSADTSLTNAQSALTALQANVTSAQAAVAELQSRILRAGVEMAELKTLASGDGNATGKLDNEATKRTAEYNAYVNDGQSGDKGPRQLAIDAKAAADAAIAARSGGNDANGDPLADGGALLEARNSAQATWDAKKQDAATAESNLTTALPLDAGNATTTNNKLTVLRQAVVDATSTWTNEQENLEAKIATVVEKQGLFDEAQDAEADAVHACEIAAYDVYRETLENQMTERAANLKKIKELLDAYEEPAPGTLGARCEKALSNGTFRAKRDTEMMCGEGNCCGAARVWMSAGASQADAGWMTIETCQPLATTEFDYVRERRPMEVDWPEPVKVPFTCIEGAHKLAAAASAVAAAVYMLA